MAREFIPKDSNLDNFLQKSLTLRNEDLETIDKVIKFLTENKDKLDALIIGISNGDETYRTWIGNLNTCYGLSKRISVNLENQMWEFNDDEEE